MKKNPLVSIILYTCLSLQAQGATKVIIFEPFSQKGVLSGKLVVAQRYEGICSGRSIANPGRSDAWRCISNNQIIDPCFKDNTAMACVDEPWSDKVMILTLKSPLPANNSPRTIAVKNTFPWAIELADGKRCTFLSGASSVIDDMRVNYSCENYRFNVIGGIDRSSPDWKVKVYDYHKKTTTETLITTAWY